VKMGDSIYMYKAYVIGDHVVLKDK